MFLLCPSEHARQDAPLQYMMRVHPEAGFKKHLKIPHIGVTCLEFCSEGLAGCPLAMQSGEAISESSGLPSGLWSVQRTWPQSLEQPKFLGAFVCFYPQGCLLCVASSIKTAWSEVDGDSCLRSELSSTVSLLTPAVAASWGLTVSCIYF